MNSLRSTNLFAWLVCVPFFQNSWFLTIQRLPTEYGSVKCVKPGPVGYMFSDLKRQFGPYQKETRRLDIIPVTIGGQVE